MLGGLIVPRKLAASLLKCYLSIPLSDIVLWSVDNSLLHDTPWLGPAVNTTVITALLLHQLYGRKWTVKVKGAIHSLSSSSLLSPSTISSSSLPFFYIGILTVFAMLQT